MSLATLKRKSNAKKRVSASGKTGNTFNLYGKRNSHVSQNQSCKQIDTLHSVNDDDNDYKISLPRCNRNAFYPQQSYKTRLNRLKSKRDLDHEVANWYREFLVGRNFGGPRAFKEVSVQSGAGGHLGARGGLNDYFDNNFWYFPEGAQSSSERTKTLKITAAGGENIEQTLCDDSTACKFNPKHFSSRAEYLEITNAVNGIFSLGARITDDSGNDLYGFKNA